MGESACLMPTFSYTSDTSNGINQGDPVGALGDSISFGRFMSESLSWEKWSSFSHNRYLEEVERYSKPGSVAQKKAYFEAHYKSIAAKKAAALLEQENAAACHVSEPETQDGDHSAIDADSEHVGSNVREAVHELQEDGAPTTDEPKEIGGMDDLGSTRMEAVDPEIEKQVPVENHIQLGSSNQDEDDENNNKFSETLKENFPANQEPVALTSKKKAVVSSSKSTVYSRTSKNPSSSAKPPTPVHRQKEYNATPNSKKCARELADQKRSSPKSLHMSINFAAAGEINKVTSPATQKINKITSPEAQKIREVGVLSGSSKASKDCSTPLRTPTRASVNGIPKQTSVTPRSEDKRTKNLLDCSVSEGRTMSKRWQSLSVDRSKSTSAFGSKSPSPTVVSPFSFRSDERAAKWKERLEKKFNAQETQKMQSKTKSKEKAENELKKLRQSLGFKAKPMPNFFQNTESPKNKINKIPPTRPRSPKLGRKPSPSTICNTSFLPPRRPAIKSGNTKHAIEKNSRNQTRSLTLPSKKSSHENASPNIQP